MPISLLPCNATVAAAEDFLQSGLEELRNLPLSSKHKAIIDFLAPRGFRVVVQLEEDGRKKRRDASLNSWKPATGEIVLYYEADNSKQSEPEQAAPLQTVSESPSLASLIPPPIDARSAPESVSQPEATNPTLANASTAQEIRECCTALAEAERLGRDFISLKWFRDVFLLQRPYGWTPSQNSRIRVLNQAVQQGYIETRSIPNPKNPEFPTTTIVLDRTRSQSLIGSRFRPILTSGEPASEIIDRDRGAR